VSASDTCARKIPRFFVFVFKPDAEIAEDKLDSLLSDNSWERIKLIGFLKFGYESVATGD